MNYRHGFHAGNVGDVLKHLVLVLLLEHLTRKAKPFAYLETHAGRGLYDLAADAASRTGEHAQGIGRLWGRRGLHPAIARYLEVVAAFNRAEPGAVADELRLYPGSPAIAQALARPDDRLVLCELHPEEHEALRRQVADDRRVGVHRIDGYQGLRAFVPPPEGRGLVLLDPPYERPDELAAVAEALIAARRRFAAGALAAWYPIKASGAHRALRSALAASQIPKILEVELTEASAPAGAGAGERERMLGSGLVILGPPWRLDETLRGLLPELCRLLFPEGGGRWRVEWIAGERPATGKR